MSHDEFRHLIDRFSMGTLDASERAHFEEHLLICTECQEAVQHTDTFLATLNALEKLKPRDWAATMLAASWHDDIQATSRHFSNYLPQYTLEAAAGRFGGQLPIEPEGWVEVHTDLVLTDDMFVAHIKGHSMEPLIADGSRCAFSTNIGPLSDGKVLLIEQCEEPERNQYAIKLCRIAESDHPSEGEVKSLHPRLILESLDSSYKPMYITTTIRAVAEFLFVLDPVPPAFEVDQ